MTTTKHNLSGASNEDVVKKKNKQDKTNAKYKLTYAQIKKNYNWGTILERSEEKILGACVREGETKDKTNARYEITYAQKKKSYNWATILERSVEGTWCVCVGGGGGFRGGVGSGELKPVLHAHNITLNSNAAPNYNAQDSSTSSQKHYI